MQDETRVEVVQADTTAAAEFLGLTAKRATGVLSATHNRELTRLAKAFARHRLAFAAPPAVEREESAWLVEENASGFIHWIALATEGWPRTKVRRLRRLSERAVRFADDDLELEDYQTPIRRVKDANEALRFARKEDAEAFIALFDRFLLCPVATEHQWPPALSLPHQADREAIAREAFSGHGRMDKEGLDRWRDIAEQTHGHDLMSINANSVRRLIGTIDYLLALSPTPSAGRDANECICPKCGLRHGGHGPRDPGF